MPTAPQPPPVALASLAKVIGDQDQTDPQSAVTVHFNPISLQLVVSNELKTVRNNRRQQYIAKTSTKLIMDLQFDTTHNGEDVTRITRKVQELVSPRLTEGQSVPREPPPPVVLFSWGTIRFKGTAEGYKETIDYFSASGVPLRAAINLTLTRQDKVFDPPDADASTNTTAAPANAPSVPAASAADAAARGGSPSAARALAEANGHESLRFGGGTSLSVPASETLREPVAFAPGGATVAAGSGAGLDLARGTGAALSAGGLARLAGLSATEGAFAGLSVRAEAGGAALRIDPTRLRPRPQSATLPTDVGATFQVGGKAALEGPSGLRADVGLRGSRGVRLTFDPP